MMVRIKDKLRPFNQPLNQQTTPTGITRQTQSTPSPAPERMTRLRSMIVDAYAAGQSTGKTPKKRVREAYDGTPRDPISLEALLGSESIHPCKRRMEQCTGFPVFRVSDDHTGSPDFDKERARVGAGAKGYCIMCDTKTNWWCRGCHHSFCLGNEGDQVLAVHIRDQNGMTTKVVKARNDCFNVAHERGINRAFS